MTRRGVTRSPRGPLTRARPPALSDEFRYDMFSMTFVYVDGSTEFFDHEKSYEL